MDTFKEQVWLLSELSGVLVFYRITSKAAVYGAASAVFLGENGEENTLSIVTNMS